MSPQVDTTGVSLFVPELDGKRVEVLIEAVPGLRRMATLADANNTTVAKLDALREGVRAHNIELSIHQVTRGEEIAAAIDNAQTSGATALNVLSSPLFFAHLHLILDRAAALRLPAIYDFPEMADEGGFAAYGPRLSQFFVKVMPQQIVKLFKGAKVADVPVEQPTTDPTNFARSC
jgi:putative tryptophan/tyrosine transport system substrate-binding protein